MGHWLRGVRARELSVSFAAGSLLMGASLANFLAHNAYGYLHPEVALVASAVLALCAGMALFYRSQRAWGRALLEGLLAATFIDFNTDLLWLAGLVGVGVGLVVWRSSQSVLGPMAVFGAVVLVTTLLGVGGDHAWIKREQHSAPSTALATPAPAILHLILDEHIGLEGLPGNDDGARRLRRELQSFYLAQGFAVYGGAYSEHLHTSNAIPHILNYGRALGQGTNAKGVVVGSTAHFRALAGKGYRLTVVQSDFADFCRGTTVRECVTYDSSSLRPTLAVPLTASERAGLITVKFLSLSDLAVNAFRVWDAIAYLSGSRAPTLNLENDGRSSSVAALAAADVLIAKLREARPGDAYFAHLLLPHFPYVVRADCTFLPWESWEWRQSTASIESRQRAYYDQVRCTMRKVAQALTALERSPAGRNAVVIIHGDHGSRITRRDPNQVNMGKFSDSDLIAGFSTLFAVRAPGVGSAYFADAQPAADLLRDFVASDFSTAPRPVAARVRGVRLDGGQLKLSPRVPLPAEWPGANARPAARRTSTGRVSD